MFSKINVFEIIRDGYKSVRADSHSFSYVLVFWIIPILIGACSLVFKFYLPKTITSDVIGGIGLFAGLMFTLLFVVTSNYKTRKEQLLKDGNEETEQYLERYLKFTQNAVSLISYSILKAGIIIFLMVLYLSIEVKCGAPVDYLNKAINFLLLVQLVQFVIVITRILNEMYAMLYDDVHK